MEKRFEVSEKVVRLMERGVRLLQPWTVDIGDEVDVGRISGKGVVIYPGCRVYGAGTVISAGVVLGREGPVTVEECRLGPGVELAGGYFAKSVFLEGARMGSGSQVREGCLLEEQASGAHGVGLKQTILFPFVTLGSLINFCDCLMAGGTGRKNHSEVGSSYIHFNFTPEGDKATASLLGDVPRGVMLNRPPIFLGGQGGMIGPVRLGFGNVVAAGTVLRRDVLAEGRLIFGAGHAEATRAYRPRWYPGLGRIVRNNEVYVGNLAALGRWYAEVRRGFFAEQEMGGLVCEGAVGVVGAAVEERCRRLADLAERAAPVRGGGGVLRRGLAARVERLRERLAGEAARVAGGRQRDLFLAGLERARRRGAGYVETIQSLPAEVSRSGTEWLEAVVAAVAGCDRGLGSSGRRRGR